MVFSSGLVLHEWLKKSSKWSTESDCEKRLSPSAFVYCVVHDCVWRSKKQQIVRSSSDFIVKCSNHQGKGSPHLVKAKWFHQTFTTAEEARNGDSSYQPIFGYAIENKRIERGS